MRPAVSSHVSSPDRTTAVAGRYNPAIVRRIVVLPLPDGPNSATTWSDSQVNSTSSGIGATWRRRTKSLWSATAGHDAPRQRGRRHERDDGDDEQRGGHDTRRLVIESLHTVIDRDAQGARLAGQVAADHEHDAELTEGVREGEHRRGQNRGPRQRYLNRHEPPPRRHAAARRGIPNLSWNGLEPALD